MKVTIKSVEYQDAYNVREKTIVEVDGEKIGEGYYGGEPEDNARYRDYGWVEDLIATLAAKLGAETEVISITGDKALKILGEF